MNFGLGAAVSGLRANQKALEVTGHNVANLGTVGYSRQSAIMASSVPRQIGNWVVEMGVDVQEIRQIRHLFNDNIYRTQSNNLGYWETRNKAIEDLQQILGEPLTKGFQAALNNFWDAFQELSKAPESLTIRALVKQRADSLVNYLNHVGSQLNKLQADLNNELKLRIEEVNEITEKIAELNVKIMSAEAAGNKPNDYYDQRNLLVDRLSTLLNAETYLNVDGSMDILVGGHYLVSRGEYYELAAVPNADLSHFYKPVLRTTAGDIDLEVGQGIIRGLLEARGEVNGAKGNYDNGTPNTTADITIAIDASDTSGSYLNNVRNQVNNLINDLKSRGLDYNIRLVVYGNEADPADPLVITNCGKDIDLLLDGIPTTPSSNNANNFEKVVNAIAGHNYPKDANKYLLVFTNESINGDEELTDDTTFSNYLSKLQSLGMTVSVATDPAYHTVGNGTEKGWNYLTENTGGKLYTLDGTTNFQSLFENISSDINLDVNTKMASIPDNLNIISSVRKQLNALINIMAREVNRIHSSGITLNGNAGGNFFEAIEGSRPMELGNIKLSDDLKDVNNIVAGFEDANGDNRIALLIADLRNKDLMRGNGKVLSLDTYYQYIILQVGNKGYEAQTMVESYQNLVKQADDIRQSVMGVSLDEEMTNMIKFKYAYNANSKVINVVDQMLETILFRLGA